MARPQQQQQQILPSADFDPDYYHDLFLNALSSEDPQTALANQSRMAMAQSSSSALPAVVAGSVTGPGTATATGTGLPNGQAAFVSPIHASPIQKNPPGSGTLTNESPFLDYDVDDPNFDWNVSGDMMPPLPGEGGGVDGDDQFEEIHEELHEGDKRKSPEDAADDDDSGGGKRRESEDKTGKKPGRKPLTSEPTSKRKAQNRAAQRAFRERKEKHLKDLEQKVDDLEKASESANSENSKLRAEVDRLRIEVKEYRKRLSLNGSAVGRSSPTGTSFNQPQMAKVNWDINNNFNFDFPRFGSTNGPYTTAPASSSRILLPGQVLESGSKVRNVSGSGVGSRPSPTTYSSPTQSTGGQGRGLDPFDPQPADDYSSLFSPSNIASASSRSNSADYLTYSQSANPLLQQRRQQQQQQQQSPKASGEQHSSVQIRKNSNNTIAANTNRATSESNTASPASSGMNGGFLSSSVTTPESTAPDSPDTGRKNSEATAAAKASGLLDNRRNIKIENQKEFFKEFATACGNKDDPVPPMLSSTNNINAGNGPNSHNTPGSVGADETPPSTTFAPQTPGSLDFQGIDWLAQQNGGSFDPVLFADYRDPQDSIMNGGVGDMGSFFTDALPLPDAATGASVGVKSPSAAPQPHMAGLSAAQQVTTPLETNLPKKHDLMREVEKTQEGRDEPEEQVPGDGAQQFLTCNLLWDRVQRSEKLQTGEYDMDDLCSQLKSKAKCSGSGPVIASKDVDAILGPIPGGADGGLGQPDFLKMFK